MATPTREALAAVGRWAPRLADPGFSMGEWAATHRDEQGRTHMPWFQYSDEARVFQGDIGRHGFIAPFDWRAWLATPRGAALMEPAIVATADADELQRLLTAIVRSDRFTEGSIAGAFESGLLLAIARRAAELADEPR